MGDLSKWLNKFGDWNTKRTKSTCSIFSIPNGLLCDVKADSSTFRVVEMESQPLISSSEEDKGRTCRACNLTFVEQSEQQQHFKCELHRINLKRRLAGLEALGSLSGIESSNTQNNSTEVGRVHFAEEVDQSSSDDEDDDGDPIYSVDNDDIEYYEDVEIEGSKIPQVYTTEEGVARKYSSKQDGPQYLFSPRKDAFWDISVSVAALHDTANTNPYEIEPWTLLSKAVQRIQGIRCKKLQLLIEMMITVMNLLLATVSESDFDVIRAISYIYHAIKNEDNSGSMWCVLILRSGRFAGAVFDSQTVLTHKVRTTFLHVHDRHFVGITPLLCLNSQKRHKPA
jgi:hypothetical protein